MGPEAAIRLIFAAIALIPAILVYFNARKRYEGAGAAFLWALGVFSLLIIFLPLYFIVRPKPLTEQWGGSKRCPSCGQYNKVGDTYCESCGANLAESEQKTEQPSS